MAKGLIVDDSKFMRKILRESLEGGGHTVVAEADNGSDGVSKYKSLKPDFVTMDITMGGLDGMKAVKAINEYDPGATIIIVSALNQKTIKMNDNTISASAYIQKPFDRDNLLNTIRSLLS
ncbi:MAG: two-component system response regulator [Spirochaetes bacterium RBG_13_51_14]|nr:MAG: two-component system response regulator [Spirochaetes bacterium RBG_13_51_14]